MKIKKSKAPTDPAITRMTADVVGIFIGAWALLVIALLGLATFF